MGVRTNLAKEYDATINALVTTGDPTTEDQDIERWAWENLVTKPIHTTSKGEPLDAGFVRVVAAERAGESSENIFRYYSIMEKAFLRKLLLEVANNRATMRPAHLGIR